MPGDERMREWYEREGSLNEERVQWGIRRDAFGNTHFVPKDYLRVEQQDGQFVKQKASLDADAFPCGHSRFMSDQEAALAARSGQRSGFCMLCNLECCPKCLGQECRHCYRFHNTCQKCGSSCCTRCLRITLTDPDDRRSCYAHCKTCPAPEVVQRERFTPDFSYQPPTYPTNPLPTFIPPYTPPCTPTYSPSGSVQPDDCGTSYSPSCGTSSNDGDMSERAFNIAFAVMAAIFIIFVLIAAESCASKEREYLDKVRGQQNAPTHR